MKSSGLNFPGVYSITCANTGKVYIGQAINIRRRWHSHKWYLRKNNHRNSHLQRAWNKYGESAFIFQVVRDARDIPADQLAEVLNAAEVEILAAAPNAFNLMEAAKSGTKLSDETKAKLSKIRKALWKQPGFRERRQASHMAAIETPEWKERHAELARERSLDPEFKKKMSAVNKQNWAKDPQRAKKRGALEKKNWKDPEYRERQSKSRSLAWADPEVRAARISAMKEAWKRRKRGA